MYLIGILIAFVTLQFILWSFIPYIIAKADGETLSKFYMEEIQDEEWWKTWLSLSLLFTVVSILSWLVVILIYVLAGLIYLGFVMEKHEAFKGLIEFLKNV